MALTTIDDRGLNYPVDLLDNEKIRFGTGGDGLEIYHDGSNSYIQDNGTGELRLRTNTGLIRITKDDTETLAVFNVDGGSELWYDNVKKLESSSSGITVTGGVTTTTGSSLTSDGVPLTVNSANSNNLKLEWEDNGTTRGYLGASSTKYLIVSDGSANTRVEVDSGGVTVTDDLTVTNDVKLADDGKLICGNSSDLKIYHDGSNSYIVDNGSGDLVINTDSTITLNPNSGGEYGFRVLSNGACKAYFDNALKFETISGGAKVSGDWYNNRNTFIGTVASGQSTISIGTSGGSQIGFFQQSTNDDELRFYTHKSGVAHAERGRMDPDGYFLWACTTQDSNNSTGIRLANTGSIFATRDQEYAAILRRSTNDGGIILFRRDSTDVGNVSVTSSATSYNTGSDYRLKQNDEPISDGITRLKQLKPIKFKWKNDTSNFVDGFFAHEVSPVVPESITGEKDAVYAEDDETGHKKGDPIYQQIDQAKLVPLLTAALQEAITEIETLKTKVAALEAA